MAKIFNPLQGLTKTIFKGKPNIFAAEDLNRYLDKFNYQHLYDSNFLGATSTNLEINCLSVSLGTNTVAYEIEFKAIDSNLTPYIFFNGVQIDFSSFLGVQTYTLNKDVSLTAQGQDVNYEMLPLYLNVYGQSANVDFNTPDNSYGIANHREFNGVLIDTGNGPQVELPTTSNVLWHSYTVNHTASSTPPVITGKTFLFSLAVCVRYEELAGFEATGSGDAIVPNATGRTVVLLAPQIDSSLSINSKLTAAITDTDIKNAIFSSFSVNGTNIDLFSPRLSKKIHTRGLAGKLALLYYEYNRGQTYQNRIIKGLIAALKESLGDILNRSSAILFMLDRNSDIWHYINTTTGQGVTYPASPLSSSNLKIVDESQYNTPRWRTINKCVNLVGAVKIDYIVPPSGDTPAIFPDGTILFTLPIVTGGIYRPTFSRQFLCPCLFALTANPHTVSKGYCLININSQGEVSLAYHVPVTGAGITTVYFDISFLSQNS